MATLGALGNSIDFLNFSITNPKEILLQALEIVNKKIESTVVFLGQPNQSEETPFNIRDVCELAFESGKRIGDVNVVKWKEGVYDHTQKQRIIHSFYSPEELAEIIEQMANDHLTPPEVGILITPSGTRFNVKNLTHTLEIDGQGFLRIDGHRLWTIVWEGNEQPLKADAIRSNKLLELKESPDRIMIIEESDPAPSFYIDLTALMIPEDSSESFFLFKREWK